MIQIVFEEMYFNLQRIKNSVSSQSPSALPKEYTLPEKLELNNFALGGIWKFSSEKAELVKGRAKFFCIFLLGSYFL